MIGFEPSTLRIGTVIGHFRVDSLLGRGGMGEVYVGVDERLQREVALKIIRGQYRLEPRARERFMREAKTLARLEHPGICQFYDLIEAEEHDVLVLELIRGRDLREALAEAPSQAVRLKIALPAMLT